MNYIKKHFLFLLIVVSFVSVAQKKDETKPFFEYHGRVEKMQDNKVILIGPASSVSFDFSVDSCSISLQSVENHQSYVSLELDGQYIGRVRVEKGEIKSYPLTVSNIKKTHHL